MSLRMTEEEYAELIKRRGNVRANVKKIPDFREPFDAPAKKPKYGNRKTEVDGIRFDSKHEAGIWIQLKRRVQAGELTFVLRQVPFDLPGGIRYFADFITVRPDMTIEAVIDAKSEATRKNRVYINKKKQIRAIYGIEIREL